MIRNVGSGFCWPPGKSNTATAYGNHGSGQLITMSREQIGHQDNPRGRWRIGQPDDPRMNSAVPVHQRRKVAVDGDQDVPICRGHFQKNCIAWIGLGLSGRKHVVALIAQPFGKPSASAAINQEFQPGDTSTSSRLSSAITAWA
jgi:hypothetical protein